MTLYKYVVTAQKPTATQFALKAAFISPFEVNLLLGKGTRIEIYTLTPDGLRPKLEFNINGKIQTMHIYQPKDREKASLFLLTKSLKYCILTYSETAEQIVTEASGTVGPVVRAPRNVFGFFDPSFQYFAVALNDATVAILTADSFNQRALRRRNSLKLKDTRRRAQQPTEYNLIILDMDCNKLVNMVFLQGTEEPSLALLYDDKDKRRHLQIFTYNEDRNKFVPGAKLIEELGSDKKDTFLIAMPPPLAGVLVITETTIRYLKQDREAKAIGIKSCSITCYSFMNDQGTRILLGDQPQGHLYLLTLTTSAETVQSLNLIQLGVVSAPACLAYLDNNIVFVGSTTGDSQLVHVRDPARVASGDILEVIDEFPSLGPITDFWLADLDKQGQGQLITCSGMGNDSSLRVIRNGVGLNEVATIEVSGVKGVWTLRPGFFSTYDNIIVLSFINQTSLLFLDEVVMRPLARYSGLALDKRTLAVANVFGDCILQVTDSSVRLMSCGSDGRLLDEWFPEGPSQITVASINATQCVVSNGYGRLVALSIQGSRILKMGETQLEHEVSCIDITPVDPSAALESSVAAVGLWQQVGVKLLSMPSLEMVAEEPLTGTAMPRSILMAKFEGICYLLVALGDGQFYNFKLDNHRGKLWDKKRSFVGKMPISLGSFTSNGTMHVFAASDKPSVIHSRNQKLIYSNVNLKDVRCVTSFNSPAFPDAVALATKDALVIGQMEEIQKLHISKIPTADTPRRIVYHETSKTFGVLTTRWCASPYEGPNVTTGGLELLDEQNLKVIDRVYQKFYEKPMAITTAVFENDSNEYYVLGTGVISDAFEKNSFGRLLVLRISPDRKITRISQLNTKGIVECLRPFQGKLVAAISGTIFVYRWDVTVSGKGQLAVVCSVKLPSLCTSLATYNDIIIAGDMLQAVSAFRYDSTTGQLEHYGRCDEMKGITAVEALSQDLYIAADEGCHIYVFERQLDKDTGEAYLDIVSQWHYGERIPRFRFGYLGTNAPDADNRSVVPSLIFCTTSGGIGVIADLSDDLFKLLWQMQNNMSKILPSIGDLDHTAWRDVTVDDYQEKAMNFIDGDLIESFLDLTPQQMQFVVDGQNGGRRLDSTVEDLCKVVEELMSVHS